MNALSMNFGLTRLRLVNPYDVFQSSAVRREGLSLYSGGSHASDSSPSIKSIDMTGCLNYSQSDERISPGNRISVW